MILSVIFVVIKLLQNILLMIQNQFNVCFTFLNIIFIKSKLIQNMFWNDFEPDKNDLAISKSLPNMLLVSYCVTEETFWR